MKKNPQGRGWQRLDNTGKLFPMIANENLSNVFRVSAVLKEEVVPELLEQALWEILPFFKGFKVKLKRGFFWYYFEENRRMPYVEEEGQWPCRYIDPKSNQLYLFRVSYYGRRINLEVFHAITDGMGAIQFLKALTCHYLDLKEGRRDTLTSLKQEHGKKAEDSYLKNYKKMPNRRYSSRPAFRLTGDPLPMGAQSVIHGTISLSKLKAVCRERSVSVTKYLGACLIWAIYEEYQKGQPGMGTIAINLPINLRAFFGSQTTSNFFAVTSLDYEPEQAHESFETILELVCRQMDQKIVKEKLEEIISYNVSREKKWYVRIIPLCIKWIALGLIFRRNDRAHTITLSNIGPVAVDSQYQDKIETIQMMIGVSRRQPVKCGVCAYGDKVICSFTSVFDDTRLQDRFFGKLSEDGILVKRESNGIPEGEEKGDYPVYQYSHDKWKRMVLWFYGVTAFMALCLGIINALTYTGLWWSAIAVPAVLYGAVTIRYSILRHANLGKSILLGTIGTGALLVLADHVLGYQGWSVNYGIPAAILFADAAVVFLILVNRMNWQSYFMYQIAITVFSLIPFLLWAAGFVTRPAVTVAAVVLTAAVLAATIFIGDRRFKNELKRRFHI